jgi:hypothetical protein
MPFVVLRSVTSVCCYKNEGLVKQVGPKEKFVCVITDETSLFEIER